MNTALSEQPGMNAHLALNDVFTQITPEVQANVFQASIDLKYTHLILTIPYNKT